MSCFLLILAMIIIIGCVVATIIATTLLPFIATATVFGLKFLAASLGIYAGYKLYERITKKK